MKCIVVSHACVAPGFRKKIAILAEDKNIDVTLVVPSHGSEESRRVYLEDEGDEGFRIIRARTLFTSHIFIMLYLDIARILREKQPDVVYVEEEPCSVAAAQIALAHRNMHRSFKLILFSWENIAERWYSLPNPRALVYPRCERLVFSQADAAIAGGRQAMQALRHRGYRGTVEIIPQFGADTRAFAKKDQPELRRQLDLDNFVIGYAGRLLPEKGLMTLLDAAARLTLPFNLLIVGRGPERKRLVRRAKELGVFPNMRFVDAIPHSSVPDYMNCMDVLVLPSRTTRVWKEQFGRVLIEAMACEVPVIGSSSGEIPSVIGPAGMIFREGSGAELAARISDVFAGDRAALGMAARKRVEENYTMRMIAEHLREFIFDISALPSSDEAGQGVVAPRQDYADAFPSK
ncbi:MAG: glycosyltransferase [Planctomycetes bacterium]|nr:glycosyltransferase [Planctomycetota bacterium]